MFLLFGLCALSVFFSESGSENVERVQFRQFMQQFKKNYSSIQEHDYRLSVFTSNMKKVERLQREELGTAQYGVTKFSDLTAEEFRSNSLDPSFVMKCPPMKQEMAITAFPPSKDWRKHGVITEVKDQGKCGSCWAFAAVGNIEAQWGIQGNPRNLSVQQVIDCGPCEDGCTGGWTWDAYMTVLRQGGLASEKEYKYEGVKNKCRKDLKPVAWIHDFQMLSKNETAMTSYVGNKGTLTVIINNAVLQHYKRGIIHTIHKSCNPNDVNHVVLIVGYVQEKRIPHWILKNSYGTTWGEQEEFGKFIKTFNKVYKNPKEFQYRLTVFISNLNVTQCLQKKEQGTAKYGITEFSDLTDEEFTRINKMLLDDFLPNNVKELKVEAKPVHKSCDWRKAGVISKVKNQTKCGSCWAFAPVGNIEAQWGILGHPVNLSVQQVLDCGPCEAGCGGGYSWDAYGTVLRQGGLASEEDYPYEGVKRYCRSARLKKVKNITDFTMLPKDEAAMASYVMNYGTIAVAVNNIPLKHYQNGVIRNPLCDPNQINHAVLIVGFSKDENGHYWIVKNSWGESWGENGFFRIGYGKNMCGISKWPLSAVVTDQRSRRIHCPA